MPTKSEYKKAKKIVDKFTCDVNKSLINPHTCICCKTKVIKPIKRMGLAEGHIKATEQGQGCWDGGAVQLVSFGYGSAFDMDAFFVAICDDCIAILIAENLVTNFKELRKKQSKLMPD